MRKLALMAVLASTAMTAPAFAKDKAWYVGVEGGGMIVEDMKFKIGNPVTNTVTADVKPGFDIDGLVGYDFGMFRVEGEVGYKQAHVKHFSSTSPIATTATGSGTSRDSALSFMVNGLLDFGPDTGFSGYVGGGAGVARVKFDGYRLNSTAYFLDDTDSRFAWQAIAGVRYPVTSNIDIGAKYRFFNVEKVRVTGNTGLEYKTRWRSHSLLASLIYNFGDPAAPPPPPPPHSLQFKKNFKNPLYY